MRTSPFSLPPLKGIGLVCPPTAGSTGASLGRRLEVHLSTYTHMHTHTHAHPFPQQPVMGANSLPYAPVHTRIRSGCSCHATPLELLPSENCHSHIFTGGALPTSACSHPFPITFVPPSPPPHPEGAEASSQTEQDPGASRGHAQPAELPTAQAVISQFTSSSLTSGSLLSAQSPLQILCPPSLAPPPLVPSQK